MAKEYTVSAVLEKKRFTDTGRLVKYIEITARTSGGVIFTLDLTGDQAQPDNAAKALAARAKELDKIKGL